MLVLGLILVLLAAGVVIGVVASGTDDQAKLYGEHLHVPTLVVFLVGAGTLLVLLAGLQLMRIGMRRANRNRQTKKRLRSLEQREEARQGQAGATPGSGTGAGTGAGAAGTGGDTGTGTGAATGTGTDTGATGTGTGTGTRTGTGTGTAPPADGPYQTPPPASR
ncbi:MAG: hypothetical protein QOF53_1967 [Nocardioidaceae bacterium]|nr:hypothetical protein [Nocardioidaceae bacterium]